MNLWKEANTYLVGGVNSPVRAFGQVDAIPPFLLRGKGASVFDEAGKEYVDYVCSWGAMIVGHGNSEIAQAVSAQAENGISFGAPHSSEVELARLVLQGKYDKARFTCSGTEALMTAIRLARGVSGRNKFVKFNGCYHGHADSFLVNAGSGALTLGVPSSPGVPKESTANTLSIEYNSVSQLEEVFAAQGSDIAAVVLEVIAGNMNMILPQADFLSALSSLCQKHGALLIADEVMSGFRVARGGACDIYNLIPDIVCYGKVIGGGIPVGCLVGNSKVMNRLAPVGDIYQAGTLAGSPLAMIAGRIALELLDVTAYQRLSRTTKTLGEIFTEECSRVGVDCGFVSRGGMFGVFFGSEPAGNVSDMVNTDGKLFATLHRLLLEEGVYIAPSRFEAGFVSLAHGDNEFEKTRGALRRSLSKLSL